MLGVDVCEPSHVRLSASLEPWSLLIVARTPVSSTLTPQSEKSTFRSRPISTAKTREILSVQPVVVLGHSSIPLVPVAKRLPMPKPELTRTFPTRPRPMAASEPFPTGDPLPRHARPAVASEKSPFLNCSAHGSFRTSNLNPTK